MTFLCITCYFKGGPFLKAAKEAGNTVYLLTVKHLEHHDWPRESIDEIFFLDNERNDPQNLENVAKGLAWLLRSRRIDRIIALDDFDVEKAAFLREEFRIPGMGQTTARHFRDKLAMRMKAAEAGVPVPPFSSLFNDEAINQFAQSVPPPWVVKPRGEASATGIRKAHSAEELWAIVNELGDARHQFLVEQFCPGDVYHVDSLSVDGELVFCQVSKYLSTPLEVAHGGGIFRSVTCAYGGEEHQGLQALTARVMHAFGMRFSASHTEFIRSPEGEYYFLETASRVGGAHLAEMVESATGVGLWTEWARLETAMAEGVDYQPPERRYDYSGILVSLARYEHPDMSGFDDPELVWKIDKPYHVGFIVRSESPERVRALLDDYAGRVARDFHASAPAPDKSAH
jgi:hypothetical protein